MRVPPLLLVAVSAVALSAAGAAWYLARDLPLDLPDLARLRRFTHVEIPRVPSAPTAAVPARAATAREAGTPRAIVTAGSWFRDRSGRVMYLRGINLGGSSKVPFTPPLATHVRDGFFEGRAVSFVGRPFPPGEADEHFARLRAWGFRFVRFLVTWEAIEHDGPGSYDEEYIEYVRAVLQKAGQYGITAFIDPHQDVWSRFSGGDGAPLWTFERVGLDVTAFHEAGAAMVHNTLGDPYPRMIWITNDSKYASATMFTLFFGGNDFAPRTLVDGVPVQEYLQSHYLQAIRHLALRLRDLPNVVGFDTLNEPSPGYIGQADFDDRGALQLGASPSILEGMLAASGITTEVPVMALGMTGFRQTGTQRLNPGRIPVWRAPRQCVWREHGVWDLDAQGRPRLLVPDYFVAVKGRRIDFARDYFKPFADRFAAMLREVDPGYLVFVEAPVMSPLPDWPASDTTSFVHAGHWYDNITLVTKTYSPLFTIDVATRWPVIGRANVRRLFIRQLEALAREAVTALKGRPTLVGEVGIPLDMNERESYRTGDFSRQEAALERSLSAIETNLLGYTLWNYTADNTNARGDQWNGEDLSVFSRDQQPLRRDAYAGGRALGSVIRAYPHRVAGTPLRYRFDAPSATFVLEFEHDASAHGPTEVFLPDYHYGQGYEVFVSDGRVARTADDQMLLYEHDAATRRHVMVVRPLSGH